MNRRPNPQDQNAMYAKANYTKQDELKRAIDAARGKTPADLVIKGAQFLDVFGGKFVSGDLAIVGDKIVGTSEAYHGKKEVDGTGMYLVPGFIDSHVHIESSMMTPVRFQQAVLPAGTTSCVWDPHEIANVRGKNGIRWALDASENLLIDIFVMVPSCVPSTSPALGFETSGAELVSEDLLEFRSHPRVLGLAEMMNFPGLLNGEGDVLDKVFSYQGKRRDGHCPGLTGKDLNAYGAAGIHSCHESTRLEEAQEKLQKGIQVLIREGSCAKDADVLLPLLTPYSSAVVGLCSDDRNPLDIAEGGHIGCIVNKALQSGHAPENIFRAASFAAAKAFGLDDRGALAPGYKADFCLVAPDQKGSWKSGLKIHGVYKNGKLANAAELKKVAEGRRDYSSGKSRNLNVSPISVDDLVSSVGKSSAGKCAARVIGVIPGQIVTEDLNQDLEVKGGHFQPDLQRDILKIAVFERHNFTGNKSVGFVRGFGLKSGAIATSINHDSHNVIVVGSSDESMVRAVNRLIEIDGGIVVVSDSGTEIELPLEIGGLMTDRDPSEVADALRKLKALTRTLGCSLEEPFLTLSFLALPVIPTLKITDRGLVDVNVFKLVSVLR